MDEPWTADGQGHSLPPIRHTITVAAPIERVWAAIATAEGLSTWFMPGDIKAEPGHAFTLQTPFGAARCRVTDVEPLRRLRFTWGEDWVVTFDLEPAGGGTRVTLTHDGWVAGKVAPETGWTHETIRARMDDGWRSTVLPRLRQAVEGSPTAGPAGPGRAG